MTAPALSIVIPTLDEGERIGALLADLRGLAVTHEVIVVDGGSRDETVTRARDSGALVIGAPRGRGRQMRAGAALASAEMLCFLHADVRVPRETLHALNDLGRRAEPGVWAFRLRISAKGWRYRLLEAAANLRSRLFGLPGGDQGLVIDRVTYQAMGGFADVPLLEDLLLARRLRPTRPVTTRAEPVVVSARRWERDGVLRRSTRNALVLLRFLGGASPEELARRYVPDTWHAGGR